MGGIGLEATTSSFRGSGYVVYDFHPIHMGVSLPRSPMGGGTLSNMFLFSMPFSVFTHGYTQHDDGKTDLALFRVGKEQVLRGCIKENTSVQSFSQPILMSLFLLTSTKWR